jgi:DNA-directed RNA polymerase specialized sigma24 family protein
MAAQKDEPDSGVLNTLCELYWYPVYVFTRRQGYGATEAEDLTQGFFARILEKKFVRSADRDRGKFRAFLLGSLKHFLSHQRDRALAQKRGGHVRHVSLDLSSAESWYQQEQPAAGATPEQMFERRWVLQLLDSALEQLHSECQQKGKGRQFEVLATFLESPGEIGYESAAAELGMTVGAARVAVHRLRARFGTLVRQLVSTTVSTPEMVDDEIRYLLQALSR